MTISLKREQRHRQFLHPTPDKQKDRQQPNKKEVQPTIGTYFNHVYFEYSLNIFELGVGTSTLTAKITHSVS